MTPKQRSGRGWNGVCFRVPVLQCHFLQPNLTQLGSFRSDLYGFHFFLPGNGNNALAFLAENSSARIYVSRNYVSEFVFLRLEYQWSWFQSRGVAWPVSEKPVSTWKVKMWRVWTFLPIIRMFRQILPVTNFIFYLEDNPWPVPHNTVILRNTSCFVVYVCLVAEETTKSVSREWLVCGINISTVHSNSREIGQGSPALPLQPLLLNN